MHVLPSEYLIPAHSVDTPLAEGDTHSNRGFQTNDVYWDPDSTLITFPKVIRYGSISVGWGGSKRIFAEKDPFPHSFKERYAAILLSYIMHVEKLQW